MDENFIKAGRIIIQNNKVSIGMIMRELKIGFNTANQIIDQLEAAGVVGVELGTKPHAILMNLSQFEKYVSEHSEAPSIKEVNSSESGTDLLFAEVGRFIIEKNKASIGGVQRAFNIGFNRAVQIFDQLEEVGVIGPEMGTSPRSILMNLEQFDSYLRKNPFGPKAKEIPLEKTVQEITPKKFTALVCGRCGGTLINQESYWVCQSCGTSFIRE